MFEQSMLLDHATGKRTGALAASVTSQGLIVGLLLLAPLIYNDRLPDARPWNSLILPPRPLSSPAEPVAATAQSPSTHPSLPIRPTFQLPSAARPPIGPVVLSQPAFDADPLPANEPAVPGWMPLQRKIVVSAPPASPAVTPRSTEKPRPVGGDVQAAKLIKKVVPAYPVLARQARISGVVRLVGVIAKDGTVQRLEIESGHPMLVRAALEAVRQWIYRPTLLNGEAVEVVAPIEVIFTLSQ